MSMPAEFITLAAAAKLSQAKANVLRKHRTPKWLAAGLARKDSKGEWWVNPAVVATIRPTKTRVAQTPALPSAHALPIANCQLPIGSVPIGSVPSIGSRQSAIGNSVVDPANEPQVIDTIAVLLCRRPVPWSVIAQLAHMARRRQKKQKTGGESSPPAHEQQPS